MPNIIHRADLASKLKAEISEATRFLRFKDLNKLIQELSSEGYKLRLHGKSKSSGTLYPYALTQDSEYSNIYIKLAMISEGLREVKKKRSALEEKLKTKSEKKERAERALPKLRAQLHQLDEEDTNNYSVAKQTEHERRRTNISDTIANNKRIIRECGSEINRASQTIEDLTYDQTTNTNISSIEPAADELLDWMTQRRIPHTYDTTHLQIQYSRKKNSKSHYAAGILAFMLALIPFQDSQHEEGEPIQMYDLSKGPIVMNICDDTPGFHVKVIYRRSKSEKWYKMGNVEFSEGKCHEIKIKNRNLAPGTYIGRVLVTDGGNNTTHERFAFKVTE